MSKTLLPIDASYAQIPTSIITGFLGSGKTTLLNRLLRHPSMQNAVVIVNEFGDVGIDHLLLTEVTEDIVLMEGGCVCCTVSGDLVETLVDLYQRRSQGELPPFDRVLMETTGLADPAPIIRALLNHPDTTRYYRLDNVVATVDGVYGLTQMDQHYETIKQAAVADRIILTKTDIAEPTEVTKLQARLRTLNPAAAQLSSANGTLDPLKLFSNDLYDPSTKHLDVQNWLNTQAYTSSPLVTLDYVFDANKPLRHDEYIRSFCIEREEPLSWKVLNRWLQQLTALRGKDLLRMKGVLHTVETDLPVVIQGVHHILQPPTTLPQWPSAERRSQMVFITKNMKQAVLEEVLNLLMDSQTPQDVALAAIKLLECAPVTAE